MLLHTKFKAQKWNSDDISDSLKAYILGTRNDFSTGYGNHRHNNILLYLEYDVYHRP